MRVLSAALLFAATVVASPTLTARATGYKQLSNGKKGTVEGAVADWGATFHASSFLSQRGCSSTALIAACYTAELPADAKQGLETKAKPPVIVGGVGTRQRSLLVSAPVTVKTANATITHTFRLHVSTAYTAFAPDEDITLAELRQPDAKSTLPAFALKAKGFYSGGTTSSAYLYIDVTHPGGEPVTYITGFHFPLGRTMEYSFKFGASGLLARATSVANGQLDSEVEIEDQAIARGKGYRLVFGGDRSAVAGMKSLKLWFGDYTVVKA